MRRARLPSNPLNDYVNSLRRLPRFLFLIVGLIVGFLVSQIIQPNVQPPDTWLGGARQKSTRSHGFIKPNQIPLPTIEQRKRVLDILTTLRPHHTRDCTRFARPLYISQVENRYSPLIGYEPPGESPSYFQLWRKGNDEEALRRQHQRDLVKKQHKYFFAINLYNSFDIIPDLFATLFRVAAILGYNNVYVSIYENGSTDQTKALLRVFDALTRSVGMRIVIRTSMRRRGAFNHRIEYLAEVRNAALLPLHELRDNEGEIFDSVVFMNDILPCVDDVLELIWQSRTQNAGLTCASDYMYHEDMKMPVFYDNWVARDINGTALENAPFESVFEDPESSDRFQRHLPIQMQACWNGIAVLDPAPLYAVPHVKFRMANLLAKECSASECSLIGNDYWNAGYGRIVMVPRVKLAYDKRVFDIIHPSRRNLSAIRGYTRLGGLPDDPRTDPQDRSWFGPHDRLFIPEENEAINFRPGPPYVWCWGWDGAGELDGPDVEPIWEKMPDKTTSPQAVKLKHDRSINH